MAEYRIFSVGLILTAANADIRVDEQRTEKAHRAQLVRVPTVRIEGLQSVHALASLIVATFSQL
jgi:hypothetical protein